MPEKDFSAKSEEEREAIVKDTVSHFNPGSSGSGTKIVVTGKGGVGKTAISAALCLLFANSGYNVLAVDGDPQMNLAPTLGFSSDDACKITPLNEQLDYIEERVGSRPNSGWGLFLTLNPKVDDVVERFGKIVNEKIKLLVMGTLSKAAIGCLCPENTLLHATVSHIALKEDEVVVMDTEAGVEHFGRAIAKGFDHAVVVTDPSFNSLTVALDALRLAKDLGIRNLHLVINRVRSPKDEQKARNYISKSEVGAEYDVTVLPYDELLYECDPSVLPIFKNGSRFLGSLKNLFGSLNTLQEQMVT